MIPLNGVYRRIALFLVILIPFIIPLTTVLTGKISFWYDPARDLLAAWDNLQKITLIGSPSGIPGIFYGPYWIWLLSLGLLVSKDPAIVVLIVATIPYLVLFPLVWFTFKKYFGLPSVILGWLLFMFSSGLEYTTRLWNPYPTPLLILLAFLFLTRTDFAKPSQKVYGFIIAIGVLLGLIINFHISFGIGFTSGVYIFILMHLARDLLRRQKQKVFQWMLYIMLLSAGILLVSMPFLVFEYRHGFHQLNALFTTLTAGGPVVGLTGLPKLLILEMFIGTFGRLLHIPGLFGEAAFILVLGYFVYLLKRKKITLNEIDRKMVKIIFSVSIVVGFIYLTAKNPVWNYYFIGLDVLFLILTALFASKMPLFRKVLTVWVIYLVTTGLYSFVETVRLHQPSYFDAQKEMIQTVAADAGDTDYAVIAYSSSIYTYDYAYLFRWLAKKNIPYDPSQNTGNEQIVYFIYPTSEDPGVQDFINFRATDKRYETVKTLSNNSGNTVLKRVKRSESDTNRLHQK